MRANFKSWDTVWDKKEFGGIARAYTRMLEKRLLNHWKPKKGAILEAGCGLGRNLLDLWDGGEQELIGVDYSKNAVDKAKKLFRERGIKGQFVLGDIRHLPFKDNSVDLIFNQGVIEHFTDPGEPVREMLRVTKKRIVILVPNTLSFDGLISIILRWLGKIRLYNYASRFPYGIETFFTKKSLCRLLKESGCRILYSRNIGVVPVAPIPARFFPPWAIHLFERLERLPLPKREIFVVAEKII